MEQKLTQAENESAEIIKHIGAATTQREIKNLVRAYVKTRYFLEEEDLALDAFNALGQMSTARTTGVDLAEIISGDLNTRCDAASPALTKKILLIIRKDMRKSIKLVILQNGIIKVILNL